MSDVLVTARCRLHRGRMGVLKERPNGIRHYGAVNVGIYARNRKLIGFGDTGDTTGWNFFEPSDYERDLDAWCKECGVEARTFRGTELLAAVENGRKSIFV